MKYFAKIGLFLFSFHEKLVKCIVALAYRSCKGGLHILNVIPAWLLALFLGAYLLPYGVFTALLNTFYTLRRYIYEFAKDNQAL